MKKVEETTRPFKYDLTQIPNGYTLEVRYRFKGLDVIDRVPNELWTEVRDIVEETGIKTISVEKKCKKAKWLSGEALQIAVSKKHHHLSTCDPDSETSPLLPLIGNRGSEALLPQPSLPSDPHTPASLPFGSRCRLNRMQVLLFRVCLLSGMEREKESSAAHV